MFLFCMSVAYVFFMFVTMSYAVSYTSFSQKTEQSRAHVAALEAQYIKAVSNLTNSESDALPSLLAINSKSYAESSILVGFNQ